MVCERIFRAYDIRGVYGVELTEEIVERIGRALSSYLSDEGKTVLLGRDVRLSSKPLSDAVARGMLSGGLNVEDIGLVTTPILYFSSVHHRKNAGVMVTASHNPPEWNGLKIWTENGFVTMGKGMEELKELVLNGRFEMARTRGKLKFNPNVLKDYEEYVAGKISIEKRLKVVVDPGNGSASLLTPRVFEKVGLEAIAINNVPDGSFPAHPPLPSMETLSYARSLVIESEADFGVGFDGDGDRALFIDDRGRIVPSAAIFITLAEHYLERHKGASIVYEVSAPMCIEETIRNKGGKPVVSRVGHTFIVERMLEEKAPFGGEMSGHYYFMDLYGFDDAVYASLKVAEILSERRENLSKIVDSLPKYPSTPSINFYCPDEKKFRVVDELAEEFKSEGFTVILLDGVKVIEDDGWFLVRASNTEPIIRLTVEARNEEALRRLTLFAEERIKKEMQEGA
ncbi:MAG: phosphomannomutase/phosphoglucomutase [Nitrososphaerota archaeon]|nr:phosphomannomutase/phosphoglucomutase [Candidatus Bathyarchaeota archaeon]MDW8048510.1 phosphomannomutase/phosphoglucomutase [Nitrososphaerota archaeon]